MTSFIKLELFEREAATPELNVKQLSLLLCGEDPELKTADIPDEKQEAYNIYYRYISKWRQASGVLHGGNGSNQPADVMFAMAYPLIDADLTPESIKKRCFDAVALIANRNGGKEILYKIGGEHLYNIGVEIGRNKRGAHRKIDEESNSLKLLGLLCILLAKKVGHSYLKNGEPAISSIYNDVVKLAEDEEISLKGISKSTVYKKIREALDVLVLGDD
ncbi:hypothetical protein [Klebsiella aerogenes]|uniref:Uncharacterized protein n=1 Tax=Klebsiella aerogenes TaxID=548 RepID=A0AAP9U5D2_KLEAE|nr:hypothetical protein [Klebsiella aerogenes]QMR40311.1 hypothetical protein HV331_12815 [Klebsiella aerogenes]